MNARVSSVLVATAVAAALSLAAPVRAAVPVPVVFGTSWDGPGQGLQDIMDAYLGAPGALNVQTGYVGAHTGDLDPWFWVGASVPALLITEVAGNANVNALGWYLENGLPPAMDGVHDGVVFTGPQGAGSTTVLLFPSPQTRFGFYLDTHITKPGGGDRVYFTNRRLNDVGPDGTGALRAPWDGDVQALVYDVSAWKGPDTWLVCFEDRDAGGAVTACCDGTDDDYNDCVFQVTALGATPTRSLSFGSLKSRYR